MSFEGQSEDYLPLKGVPLPADWADQARCRGARQELFFPTRGDGTRVAKALCERCPVREECLEYALRWFIHHGVWGGKTEKERRLMRRRRRRAA